MSTYSGQSRIILAFLISTLSMFCHAANFSVGPVRIDMNPVTNSSIIQVRSGDFQNSVLLQATPYTWTEVDGERVLEADTDLEVFPTVINLSPGSTQSIVLRSRGAASVPRYYRVRIEEITSEVRSAHASSPLTFRQIYDIPVFVEESGSTAVPVVDAAFNQEGNVISVTMTNKGNARTAATRFTVIASDTHGNAYPEIVKEHRGLYYLLPGHSRTITFPVGGLTKPVTRYGLEIEDSAGNVMFHADSL